MTEELTAKDLESRAKLKSVKDQIEAIMANPDDDNPVIRCPYCHINNFDQLKFCCDTLRRGVLAIMMGKRAEKVQRGASQLVN